MYIDRIWPFTTFILRNKHKKNIRLRLYWLRLRVAEAEVQTSHPETCTPLDSAPWHALSTLMNDSVLLTSDSVSYPECGIGQCTRVKGESTWTLTLCLFIGQCNSSTSFKISNMNSR